MGQWSARWSWVLLPEDEALARWRWEQRASRIGAATAVALAVLVVVAAVVHLRDEATLTHVDAFAVAERDRGRTLVEWEDGTPQRAVHDDPEHGLAVGDTIEVVYPPGHPEQARAADGPEVLIGMLALLVVVVGGVAVGFVVRYAPRARQLALLDVTPPGTPRTVEIVEANGRSVVLGRDAEHGTALVVGIGGASTLDVPLPPSPQDAVVLGEVVARSVVVVRLGDALLNTVGRVRVVPASASASEGPPG